MSKELGSVQLLYHQRLVGNLSAPRLILMCSYPVACIINMLRS